MNKKYNFDKKSSASIILAVFVCFLMVGIYVVTNALRPTYALPVSKVIDASEISKVTSKLVNVGETETDVYVPTGKTTWYSMKNKFQGETTYQEKKYTIDMFCLEVLKEMADSKEYNKLSDSTKYIDEGISYIINTAYNNVQQKKVEGGYEITLPTKDYYNAQLAIWIYQEKQNPNKDATGEDKNTITQLNTMWTEIETNVKANTATNDEKTIYNYVVKAQEIKNSKVTNSIEVTNGKEELTLSDDKKYYQTDLLKVSITTAPNTQFSGFNFTLDSKDYNTIVVDENGAPITDYSQLKDKKFRIKIDASQFKEGTSTTITGEFAGIFTHSSFLAYSSTDQNLQIALLATSSSTDKNISLKFKVVVPDTGVDYSQYIYMIGAMILVIGLAVIYVNAKQEQN